FTWSVKARTTTSTTAGTYAITFYLQGSNNGAVATGANANSQSVTWNVTVSALSTTVASIVTYSAGVYAANTAQDTIAEASAQALYYRNNAVYTGAKESAIVFATTTADAQSPRAAGVVYGFAANSAGETFTATYTVNICASGCAVTAVIEGPGLLGKDTEGATTAPTKSVTMTYYNGAAGQSNKGDTLTVYADGTAGTSTLKFYNGSTLLKSLTLTFTGVSSSASSVSLSDTFVAIGSTTNLRGIIKDAAGNAITSGTLYVWASDTKVVSAGAVSTNATQYTQFAAGVQGSTAGRCASGYDATLGRFSCQVTINDSATATLKFSDSWTVAASTWTSGEVTVTGLGKAASYTVTFDKTSYTAGEQAVITVTGKDMAGRTATGQKNNLLVTTSLALGNGGASLATSTRSPQTITSVTAYQPRQILGTGAYETSETFVVLMPSNSGTLKVTLKSIPESTDANQAAVEWSGSATVTDPAEVAAKAATEAADAATDAALQAIDAANAATDAANLAAEAA
ncbi:MAG: hypothetical protein EBU84_18285, partial [Actinobacteria bacterium]|nr:hypothetical protein [Actinomycetota bacterium]